jgi:exonuclease III
MNIITWNIGEYGRDCKIFPRKFRVLRELIMQDKPDVFCIIEGTQSKNFNRLLKHLFRVEGYSCYYDPSIPANRQGEFDWNDFHKYGLKIFVKIETEITLPNLEPSSILFKGRLIRIEIDDFLFIFLHRNRSAENYDQDQFIGQIKKWVTSRQKDRIKNVFILGDFNLSIWDEKYFSENSGYIRTSFVNRQYELRISEDFGVDFFNPIIDVINRKDQLNLGGTYYNENNQYGWAILDYVLVKEWDRKTENIDLLTSFGKYDLINSDKDSQKYINYKFDHLPIKLTVK